MNNTFMTRKEAADWLGVTPQTISNYETKGLLHAIRTPRKGRNGPIKRYSREEVHLLRGNPAFNDFKSIDVKVQALRKVLQDEELMLSLKIEEKRKAFQEVMTGNRPKTWYRYREIILQLLKTADEKALSVREAAVLRELLDGKTIREVARSFSISNERVRQVYKSALRHLLRLRNIADAKQDEADKRIKQLEWEVNKLNDIVWALKNNVPAEPATAAISDNELFRNTAPFKVPLDDYGLSVRTGHCLKAAEIRTVGDLVAQSRRDISRIRNLGRKSLFELDLLLMKLKLHWEMWTDPDYDYKQMRKKRNDNENHQ